MTPSTSPLAGTRTGLSADAILESALRLLETQGLEALTMRRLAAACDVSPMSLYTYFASKEELLDRMVEAVIDRLPVTREPDSAWDDQVCALMRSFRDLLLSQPGIVRLFITRRVVTHGLTQHMDAALELLVDAGFAGEEAVRAYSVLLTYTLGFVVFEIPRSGARRGDKSADEAVARLLRRMAGGNRYPSVAALATELSTMSRSDNFEYGLRRIVDGFRFALNER